MFHTDAVDRSTVVAPIAAVAIGRRIMVDTGLKKNVVCTGCRDHPEH